MRKLTSIYNHQNSIKVEWNLGKRCNLDCAYCPSEIHDNISPHTNIKVLTDTVDTLCELDKPIRVSLTGGEPCIHPDVEKLIDYLNQKVDWINITTNGTRSGKWYCEQPVDHYVFSLHFDNEVWKRSLENIIMVGKWFDKPIHVNLMAHHEHMDLVRSAYDDLNEENIPVAIRRIRWTNGDHDTFDDLRYEAKDLEWILSTNSTVKPNCVDDDGHAYHANDIIKQHMNKFKDWNCSAGIESLMINWDGEVHRATCRVGGSLGNIYKGSFEAPTKPIICTRNWCTCAADIPLTKEKND